MPDLTTPSDLAGATVVVIDVLRASTTICHALAAGAREVIACGQVEEAREIAARLLAEATRQDDDQDGDTLRVVLGGEREGLPIEGFDLGNSPGEYTQASVGGATVVFTTTNGTRAMMACREASEVLIAGFVNLSAVVRQLDACESSDPTVHVVCAGTRGSITSEDVLLAGALAARRRHPCNDQATLARAAWQSLVGTGGERSAESSTTITPKALAAHLAEHSQGGRNLASIGLADDILIASQIDRFDIVPRLDVRTWRITARDLRHASRGEPG